MPLTVIAYFQSKPGKEKELEKILQGFVVPTRAEKGCINYDLHRSNENSGAFVFYENWTDKASLDVHLKTPHITKGIEAVKDLIAAPVKIDLLTKIE